MNKVFKIKDKVWYKGKHYEVVCMDKEHYGLMPLDDNYKVDMRASSVLMVSKRADIQDIAELKFKIGQEVRSKLNGDLSMIGYVVGFERHNGVVVKSHKSTDRIRYYYTPNEIEAYVPPKRTYLTFVIDENAYINTPHGQMRLNAEGITSVQELEKLGKLMGLRLVKVEEK